MGIQGRRIQKVISGLTLTNYTYNFATPCYSRAERNIENRNVESYDDSRFEVRISLSGILHSKSPSLGILLLDKSNPHAELSFVTSKREDGFGFAFSQTNLTPRNH